MNAPDTVSQYVAALRRALSSDRLDAYRPQEGDDLAMIATYFWNVALCQALYPSLGALEVAMRNGIHDALRARFGRDDWYDIEGVLLPAEVKRVERAKKKIRDAKRDEIVADHDPATPGRVVASLTFGDWTSLLDAGYGGSPKGPQFWAPTTGLLAAVFPPCTERSAT